MPGLTEVGLMLDVARRVRELGSDVLSILGRLRRHPADRAPGDKQTRTVAYVRFQESAAVALFHVQLIATLGTPPRLVGAVWTWPSAWRAMRRFSEGMTEMLTSLLGVALVGDQEVLDRAIIVGEKLGSTASSFPARRGGGDLSPEFAELAAQAGEELGRVRCSCSEGSSARPVTRAFRDARIPLDPHPGNYLVVGDEVPPALAVVVSPSRTERFVCASCRARLAATPSSTPGVYRRSPDRSNDHRTANVPVIRSDRRWPRSSWGFPVRPAERATH